MNQNSPINSNEYWDKRFLENWENFQGPKQSRFFSRLALCNLPAWLVREIKNKKLSVVDWGCAQGDGTNELVNYFEINQITGVDFSEIAIAAALGRYPKMSFVSENWLNEKISGVQIFDIVYSSNTLEHFHKPYDVLQKLSKRAKKAVILALPYQELDRIDEHFYSFLANNIPLELSNGFRLIWSKVVDCRQIQNSYWNGDQIFLVYAQPEWLSALNLLLADTVLEQVDNSSELARLTQCLNVAEGRVASISQVLLGHDEHMVKLGQDLAQHNRKITELTQILKERDDHIAGLSKDLSERDLLVSNMHSQIEQIVELDQDLAQYNRKIIELTQILKERDEHIASLCNDLLQRDLLVNNLNSQIDAALVSNHEVNKNLIKTKKETDDLNFKFAQLHNQTMELSNWANQINSNPIGHAFKKNVLGVARYVFRALPFNAGFKYRLRNSIRKFNPVAGGQFTVKSAELIAQHVSLVNFDQNRDRDILFFSVIDWHFRTQRPQQLATGFAKAGNRVFYFSNHFIDSDVPGYEIELLDGSLNIFQVKLFVKGAPAIYFEPATTQAETMLKNSFIRFALDYSVVSNVAIIEHAYWYNLVRGLPDALCVYDCMDHHEGFGNVPEKLIKIEKNMLQQSDVVLVTSTWLENFAKEFSNNIALVRNACDFEHFSKQPSEIYIDPLGRKIIGYYGAIAEWFDLDLVAKVAEENPDKLVLLIGDDTVNAHSILGNYTNVVFIGEVAYQNLPFYLYAFDVCILPFKVIPLTLATNPVKVYEYLAAGKPVVSIDLPEIAQFGNAVSCAKSVEEFVTCINQELESRADASAPVAKRKEFAVQQTWSQRIVEIRDALESVKLPKISVIVLTFNNLALTKACLDSLVRVTDYVNLEIIVVDNASTDETPGYLREFELLNPTCKVILNQQNVGFAAGNNIGLAAATGDYLVMLNNDTVVTRGWALTMMRHLQFDESIGLVGPITNNIGNEARVEMNYVDLVDMPEEAFQCTLKKMGQKFPIKNVAFFCVMMPRSTYEKCGPLCEEYGLGFFEDDDYCRRVEMAGLSIVCAEDVFIHHHLSASFNKLPNASRQELMARNKAIYESKWGRWEPHVYQKR